MVLVGVRLEEAMEVALQLVGAAIGTWVVYQHPRAVVTFTVNQRPHYLRHTSLHQRLLERRLRERHHFCLLPLLVVMVTTRVTCTLLLQEVVTQSYSDQGDTLT